jgi:Sortase domain
MVPRTRPQGRRRWWLLLALGLAAVVGGGFPLLTQATAWGEPPDAGSVPGGQVARASQTGPPGPTELTEPSLESAAGLARADAAARAGSAGRVAPLAPPPVRMTLPRLGIDARVLPVSVGVDGLLAVPDNPRELGWWSGSGRPGMPSGSVVVNGHVDSATLGPGALFRLREARPGDKVLVVNSAQKAITYTVVARRRYAKASLPVAEVFARDVGPRLVLLTCGGLFDQASRHYADNIVVYAVPS